MSLNFGDAGLSLEMPISRLNSVSLSHHPAVPLKSKSLPGRTLCL